MVSAIKRSLADCRLDFVTIGLQPRSKFSNKLGVTSLLMLDKAPNFIGGSRALKINLNVLMLLEKFLAQNHVRE